MFSPICLPACMDSGFNICTYFRFCNIDKLLLEINVILFSFPVWTEAAQTCFNPIYIGFFLVFLGWGLGGGGRNRPAVNTSIRCMAMKFSQVDGIVEYTWHFCCDGNKFGFEAVQKRFFSGLFFVVLLTYISYYINK